MPRLRAPVKMPAREASWTGTKVISTESLVRSLRARNVTAHRRRSKGQLAMSDLSHLRVENTATSLPYTYAGPENRVEFSICLHVTAYRTLKRSPPNFKGAKAYVDAAHQQQPPANEEIDGYPLTLRSDAGYELKLGEPWTDDSMEWSCYLFVRTAKSPWQASMFSAINWWKFLGLISDFENKDKVKTEQAWRCSFKPKNQALIQKHRVDSTRCSP